MEQLPDYYSTPEECENHKRKQYQTNSRYKHFKQTHYTAGDEEQFHTSRTFTNMKSDPNEDELFDTLHDNLFSKRDVLVWTKFQNLCADSVDNTFRYMFHKFKKGLFIKILDNKLHVFLPFSKAKFVNDWSNNIRFDKTRYKDYNELFKYIAKMEGRRFHPKFLNSDTSEWYANNCLLRCERPISESDTNVAVIKNMLEELCETRTLPDTELFINRRDFPILTRDCTEPYHHLWGTKDKLLVSHLYPQYAPILSPCTNHRYADILMPTTDDWARVQAKENKWFPKNCREYTTKNTCKWSEKYSKAVFRGSSTGVGTTIDTNPRLKAAYLSLQHTDYLDAGITKWNCRVRKDSSRDYVDTIHVKELPFEKVEYMSFSEQCRYKYILHIDGHVKAYRLSQELGSGSLVLMVQSEWNLWYSDMLKPYVHYVPVKADLSNLIEQIKWCVAHDDECQDIVQNATTFYDTVLCKKGILDFLQNTIAKLKYYTGTYTYPSTLPLDVLIRNEHMSTVNYTLPPSFRRVRELFHNNSGTIYMYSCGSSHRIVKTTSHPMKRREHIHESFIGTQCLNDLVDVIPNFVKCYGLTAEFDGTTKVIFDYVDGCTLLDYIRGPTFKMDEFVSILYQLALALEVAQQHCAFIHYDLTPWNIMIQTFSKPQKYTYRISEETTIELETTIVPVIIDYGKSHVIHNDIHHGFTSITGECRFQDIFTLLSVLLPTIVNARRLPPDMLKQLVVIGNILTGSVYRNKQFDTVLEMKQFLSKRKSFDALLQVPKIEIGEKYPYYLCEYLSTHFPNVPCSPSVPRKNITPLRETTIYCKKLVSRSRQDMDCSVVEDNYANLANRSKQISCTFFNQHCF